MSLSKKDGMRLVKELYAVAGDGDVEQVLATALAEIAVARAMGRGLGAEVDLVLGRVLEQLTLPGGVKDESEAG